MWAQRRAGINSRQQFRLNSDCAVHEAFHWAKQRYGAPRLTDELHAQGYRFNVKTVADSLRRRELRAKASRTFSTVSYREHGLSVSENLLKQDFYATGPNQKWSGGNPARLATSEAINQSGSVDFIHDSLVSGRHFRTFNVVDDFNREALAIEIDLNIPAQRVIRVLDRIVAHRGYPLKLRMDNGLPSESTILHEGILPSNTKTIVHFNIRYCPHFLSAYKYAYHDIQGSEMARQDLTQHFWETMDVEHYLMVAMRLTAR